MKPDTDLIDQDCYRLITQGFSSLYIFTDQVKFAFDNRTNQQMLDYQIIASGTGDYISPLPTINLNPGLNKIDIDLSNTNIQYGVPYILIVDDIYHQSYYMKFLKHEARIKNINLDSE